MPESRPNGGVFGSLRQLFSAMKLEEGMHFRLQLHRGFRGAARDLEVKVRGRGSIEGLAGKAHPAWIVDFDLIIDPERMWTCYVGDNPAYWLEMVTRSPAGSYTIRYSDVEFLSSHRS